MNNLMRRCCLAGLGLALTPGIGGPVEAAEWDGNGGVGGDWFTDVNWDTDAVPTAGDAVLINANSSAASPVLIDDGTQTAVADSIFMAQNSGHTGYLTIRTDLDVTGQFTVGRKGAEAIVDHESGDVTAGNFFMGFQGGPTAYYNMTGGTLTTAGNFDVGRGDGTSDIRFNQSDGTVTVGGGFIMGTDPYTGGSQQYNLSGGALVVNGSDRTIGWKAEGNEFNHSGGTATFNDTAGFANINQPGEITVRFSEAAQFTANAAVNFGSGGGGGEAWIVLDGSKTGAGSDVMVAGNNVHFNVLSHLEAIIDAAAIAAAGDMRKFDVDGTATFEAGALLNPSFDTTPSAGTWTLLSATTLVDNGLAFDPSVDTNLWSFSTDNNELTVSYVPEPASLALLGAGGLMLLGRRRRNA